MNINKNEVIITGKWLFQNNQIVGDENCIRIEYLIENYLIFIRNDYSGWETLYKDPIDGRYWELTYPHSELQGGGPQQLKWLDSEITIEKYNLSKNES